jgi:hypothetical protein
LRDENSLSLQGLLSREANFRDNDRSAYFRFTNWKFLEPKIGRGRRWRENWQHVLTQIFGFLLKRTGLCVNEKSKKAQKEKVTPVVCCLASAKRFRLTNFPAFAFPFGWWIVSGVSPEIFERALCRCFTETEREYLETSLTFQELRRQCVEDLDSVEFLASEGDRILLMNGKADKYMKNFLFR